MKRVIVLGATGSVGGNALAVIRAFADELAVVGLVAGRGSEALSSLCREFPGAAVAAGVESECARLRASLSGCPHGPIFDGPDGALRLIAETEADICVAAVSGLAGIDLTFAAAAKGMTILLANKEVLVSAGRLFMDAVRAGGSRVLPLDSEHTALWQCLEGHRRDEVKKLTITASGGPFLHWTAEQMASARPADALRHPVWRMGEKISIDSATLANKALELIEAHYLFDFTFDAMDVVVHPQSAVHGMIECIDGSVIAHLGVSDMRQPIAYMLHHPYRRPGNLPSLDLVSLGKLEFFKPDTVRFPMLNIGLEAGRRGGACPALFNAANETAVRLFLAERIGFSHIVTAVESVMARCSAGDPCDLAHVAEIHESASRGVMEFAERIAHGVA